MAKLYKFKVLRSVHQDRQGNIYKPGDIVTSKVNLMEKYPNKFEPATKLVEVEEIADEDLTTAQPGPAQREVPTAPLQNPVIPPNTAPQGGVTPPPDSTAKGASETAGLGEDVTSEFPNAAENGLLVFKGKVEGLVSYFVADDEDPTKALNEERLTKSKVAEFVEEYLG